MARISIFLPSLAGGGAERSIATVANGLAGRGHEVSLVLASWKGPYLKTLHPDLRRVDLGSSSMPAALWGLTRHLKMSKPDVLLAAMSHANVVAALARRLAGSRARLVLSERAHLSSMLAEYPDLRMRITHRLMRLTYPWADCVVAVSEGVADDLARQIAMPAHRLRSIYNPVVDEVLQRQAGQAPAHPWLNQPTLPVVLAAGRLVALKDFSTLVQAFAQLRRVRKARLVILGEGELRQKLLVLAADLGIAADVSLPGFADNPFAAMRAARVFVLSSRFEGLPGVLIQAMACGARVVATDCPGGTREVLEEGRWGRLVPVGDTDALAAAMAAALDDPDPPDVRQRAAAFGEQRAIDAYAEALGVE
jgi:glycosyltransferase involved in cell wall biosynthesis